MECHSPVPGCSQAFVRICSTGLLAFAMHLILCCFNRSCVSVADWHRCAALDVVGQNPCQALCIRMAHFATHLLYTLSCSSQFHWLKSDQHFHQTQQFCASEIIDMAPQLILMLMMCDDILCSAWSKPISSHTNCTDGLSQYNDADTSHQLNTAHAVTRCMGRMAMLPLHFSWTAMNAPRH